MKLPQILTLTGLFISKMILGQFGFTEITNHNLPGASATDITSFDYDNDNDSDLIISGFLNNSTFISQLYDNDGYGNFVPNSNVFLHPVKYGKILTSDFNQDKYKDIIIFGQNPLNKTSAYLYINDGIGNFNAKKIPGLDSINLYTALQGDMDNDNDIDLIISGRDTNHNPHIFFLLNDGIGNFTIQTDNLIKDQILYNTKITDVDNDSDLDLISFDFQHHNDSSCIFINDGNGNFSKKTNNGIPYFYNSKLQIGDLNNDGLVDLVFLGTRFNRKAIFTYTNDGNGYFSELDMFLIHNTYQYIDIFLSDIDQNNTLDILIMNLPYNNQTQNYDFLFYENYGNGISNHYPTYLFEGLNGDIEILDFDNDQDQDLIMTGVSNQIFASKMFRNNTLVSINEIRFIPQPVIFPNPSKGSFSIDVNTDIPYNLKIRNISGKIIYQNSLIHATFFNLDLDIPAGIYLLEITSKQSTTTSKIIIK